MDLDKAIEDAKQLLHGARLWETVQVTNVTYDIYHEFQRVHGVGHVRAMQWIQQGYRTLGEVANNAKLTPPLRMGIDRVHDFEQKIPRDEAEQHETLFRTALARIDPLTTVTVVGSYRRGLADIGDMDFLVTASHVAFNTLSEQIFDRLIPELYRLDYIKGQLATGKGKDKMGRRWLGAAAVPGSGTVWRRVDILLAPPEEYGAALWYFTGSQTLNRGMERLAESKGFVLDNTGLWRLVRDEHGDWKGTLVEGRREERIFKLLDEQWRAPDERNV
ncbi:hypothetical protein MMC13_001577 [Lambiella insularis]|nr:hypothetical protein [Lambiella insularis]